MFSEPYLENRLILVGRRGSDVSATRLAALAGKRIVLVGGYSDRDEVAGNSGPVFFARAVRRTVSLDSLRTKPTSP